MNEMAGKVDLLESLPEGSSRKGYIWGRALRFVLVGELMRRPETTVAELVAWLGEQGYQLPGRPSKVVSDGLRWEVARGRVTRLGRGRYRYHRAPATTARRIRLFARRCRDWIVATKRGQPPPPTPPDPRSWHPSPAHNPADPPWQHMTWLWST